MSSVKPRPLYFMTHSSKDAGGWPFYDCMRHPETEVRVFAGSVSLKYTRRVWLYVIGWPKLFLSALQLSGDCIRELKPDTVVTAHDHMLLLAFKMRRLVSRRARSTSHDLVLHGFIYTPRRYNILNALRKFYFTRLLKGANLVICHSNHEVSAIETLVDPNNTKVKSVHYGIGEGDVIKAWWKTQKDADFPVTRPSTTNILAAGRSSRDYDTLAQSIEILGPHYECEIICDNFAVAPDSLQRANLKLRRNTYGSDYLNRVLASDIVVVPTTADDISSGQMVLLHALAAAKPVVMTKTPTSIEYLRDTPTSRLVPAGDSVALAKAIEDIRNLLPLNPQTRDSIRQMFENSFSDKAHGQKVYTLFKQQFVNGPSNDGT